jgi:hypothetical protein
MIIKTKVKQEALDLSEDELWIVQTGDETNEQLESLLHAARVSCLVELLAYPFPTLIPLSGVGTTYFHVVIKVWQLFLRPAACLTLTPLETGVSANDCKCGTNGLTCLPKHGGARDNKFFVTHPMTDQRC